MSERRPPYAARWRLLAVLLLAVAAAVVALVVGTPPPDPVALSVAVISSPPDQVSGGSARLRISGAPPDQITVEGGEAISEVVAVGDGVAEVVVSGLEVGANPLEVRSRRGDHPPVSITLTNYPAQGPIFSGPHQRPFRCSTPSHRARAELGDPQGEDCLFETVVSFKYRTTAGTWADYRPGPRPADMAVTTTSDGRQLDYIVRWERGTINRFIYSIAVLSPFSQEPGEVELSGWNRRLVYSFGGGVGIGRYQGNPSPELMLWEPGLALGYAIAYSTGTSTGTHTNLELGGETAVMVKSRFVTAYGTPEYTVGVGSSGGALQQYVYSQNHPGLLDAAIAVQSFPDLATQMIHVGDCELLERWFDAEVLGGNRAWADWERRRLAGGGNAGGGRASPFNLLTPFLPPGSSSCVEGWRGLTPLVLNPHYVLGAGGEEAEWTIFADSANVYGLGEDGYTRRPWDNVGVQYGLAALVAGDLSAEEFLDLNANVGSWKPTAEMTQERCPYLLFLCPSPVELLTLGTSAWPDLVDVWSANQMQLSPDGGATPAPRAAADPEAVEAAYRRGFVFVGDTSIPIIDWRPYLDHRFDRHAAIHSFSARQRMLDHDGDASNQVIWMVSAPERGRWADLTDRALAVIDQWMTTGRPADAVDACFHQTGDLFYAGEDAWAGILDQATPGPCAADFPIYPTSRMIAGGPLSGDVFKCHTQSIEEAVAAGVYGEVRFSPSQSDRLRQIFPDGVCDHTRGDALRPGARGEG